MRKYGRHLRQIPMLASQLTVGLVRKWLRVMSPSSMQSDGWGQRSLLARALDWLAELLLVVEDRSDGRGSSPRGTRPSS